MRGLLALLIVLSCAASAEDAEVVDLSRAPKQPETQIFAALAEKPQTSLLNYECRKPANEVGQNAGFRVEISADYRLRIYTSHITQSGKRSSWALMFEQEADREAVGELLKWMERKKLDKFDARTAAEKCAEIGKPVYRESAPNETLTFRFPHCAEPSVIYWRDLLNDVKQFPTVAEVRAINNACEEMLGLALAACPEKAAVRAALKRE